MQVGNQNIGLNLYIFKTFFSILSVFYFSLFLPPTPEKQRTAPRKVLKARE